MDTVSPQSVPPTTALTKPQSTKTLSGPFTLIKKAFTTLFMGQNLGYIIKVNLVSFLITSVGSFIIILPFALIVGFTSFDSLSRQAPGLSSPLSNSYTPTLPLWVSIVQFILFIPIAAVNLWTFTSQFQAVVQAGKGEIIGTIDTLKIGWSRTWKLFLTLVLTGLLSALGFVFLIIPGIVIGVWLSFVQWIAITEDLGIVETLKKSKALVSGYFWAVWGRFWAFALLMIPIIMVWFLIFFIPIFGIVAILMATFLMTPFFLLFQYFLFEDLKRVRGGEEKVE